MKPDLSPLFRAALAAVALTALPACQPSQSKQAGGAMPPPEVTVVVAQPRDLPASFEYVGQIAGVREVEVRPRVSGILERWNYQEGAKVAAGQSLFTIDSAPYRAALARAEAQLASAEASLSQSSRDAARLKPLFEAKAVSQKDYDDAVSSAQVASANVKAAQAAVTEARLNLSYTRVEAPISGITSRALQSEGSLVQAQQTLLTTISQIDPIHVIFSFTEAEHLKFTRAVEEGRLVLPKDGKFDVKLKLADGSEYARAGKVDFTDVRVDPNTGTIEARAVIANPQGLLRPGQFARVTLAGGMRPGAIAIPQRAVLEGPGTKIVLTVNAQGIVEPRPVQVGDWSGEDWIILGGLKAGDQVIVDGVVKARPGSPVKIAEAPSRQSRPARPCPGRQAGCRPAARQTIKGHLHVLALLHRPPDLCGGPLDLPCARGSGLDAYAADCAISGDRPAGGDRARRLSRRLRRGARADRRRAAGKPDQRRRGHALHGLEFVLQRGGRNQRHLRDRHQRRPGGAERQQPRQAGGSPVAAGSTSPGRDGGEEFLVVPAGAGLQFTRRHLRRPVCQQLRHAERARHHQTDSGHHQRADLRRQGLCDADLAAAGPNDAAQAHHRRSAAGTERAERTVRRRQDRPGADRRAAGDGLHHHHQGPARRRAGVREHHRPLEPGRLGAAPEGRGARRTRFQGLRLHRPRQRQGSPRCWVFSCSPAPTRSTSPRMSSRP